MACNSDDGFHRNPVSIINDVEKEDAAKDHAVVMSLSGRCSSFESVVKGMLNLSASL